jgi:crossover junction endodeoxyribonuclease RuvC
VVHGEDGSGGFSMLRCAAAGVKGNYRHAWQNRCGMSTARILGIDPGLNRTGWGVIEQSGQLLRCVDYGVIRVPAGELPQRLAVILRELAAVIAATQPTCASVEKVFVNVNPQSTLLLGQARGAALCALVGAGLTVHEHTALQVKQAVVGYGKAAKLQVQTMVQRLLALAEAPGTDAADALACAICQAHTGPLAAQVLARSATARGQRSRRAWRSLPVPGSRA